MAADVALHKAVSEEALKCLSTQLSRADWLKVLSPLKRSEKFMEQVERIEGDDDVYQWLSEWQQDEGPETFRLQLIKVLQTEGMNHLVHLVKDTEKSREKNLSAIQDAYERKLEDESTRAAQLDNEVSDSIPIMVRPTPRAQRSFLHRFCCCCCPQSQSPERRRLLAGRDRGVGHGNDYASI